MLWFFTQAHCIRHVAYFTFPQQTKIVNGLFLNHATKIGDKFGFCNFYSYICVVKQDQMEMTLLLLGFKSFIEGRWEDGIFRVRIVRAGLGVSISINNLLPSEHLCESRLLLWEVLAEKGHLKAINMVRKLKIAKLLL